ncbi:glycoside hydrolase TIM-barrel-like domain-containing protein [Pseudovibrio sp. JE062]|uniref:baseplate multidomain protein megatron n=1 Tax=Pseudovibrio sp. JE062 TaxID=439495 RepID=UPI000186B845|nr:glycoside hydrolase TIM-barrel-like domain-containing protein [Pseudovibrio sp. JE062]EEA94171.1 putative gene transfer agent orfg15 protein [Pseudovibrio sp. JE062]
MATMVLSNVGAAVGSALGGPIGAIVGQTLGAVGGAWIDQQIFGETREVSVGKLGDLQLQTAAEGASLPFVYGRVRVTGNITWATRLEEVVSEEKQGGKSTGSSTTVTSHSYFANFAVALCEGPITSVRRVWANGKQLDTSSINMRIYLGAEDQQPDPLIEAKQGSAPAYKGTAYVVFERLPLAEFGNRIPQLSFEVLRSIEPLEQQIKAVTLIPGAGEFAYHPQEIIEEISPGNTRSVNRHGKGEETDLVRSLDELQALCPNLKSVALVVSWFGDDLRASHCTIQPKVTYQTTQHLPENWSVAGLSRSEVPEVSRINDRPAYGGTPSDASVTEAIKELKRRGLKVMFYPFIMMDIPEDNQLPDPYGATRQSSYPWRGRITSDIAAGQSGTPQGTSAVTSQIDAFVGNGNDWRFHRFILHYANLVKAAGGVEAFLIGSELRGLTQCWAGGGLFPFVDHLQALATEVRQIIGTETKLSYAADWSEYAGYSPQSGDLRFPLDPLWGHADIDFVGIDYYLPLTDLRKEDSTQSSYDLSEMRAGIASGEYYDWYYASDEDRTAKTRSLITDGAHNKPWVFRQKDLKNWWQNQHFERAGNAEQATPTPWTPQSKPIWFTELGFPAVDKGTNQPNVFVDPKSAESALPHFSNGQQDDLVQRRAQEASLSYWGNDHPDWPQGDNPTSSLYGGNMVEADNTFLWTWDARPYPEFPTYADIWADGQNWQLGHWLTGRLGALSASGLIRAMRDDFGHTQDLTEIAELGETIEGLTVSGPTSLRSALTPILQLTGGIAVDRGTHLAVLPRYAATAQNGKLGLGDLLEADEGEEGYISINRNDGSDLPAELRLRGMDPNNDFEALVVTSRRLEGMDRRTSTLQLPITMSLPVARKLVEKMHQLLWLDRETFQFKLALNNMDLKPGDIIELPVELLKEDNAAIQCRITEISSGAHMDVQAIRLLGEPTVTISSSPDNTTQPSFNDTTSGPPIVRILDLPRFHSEGPDDGSPVIAIYNGNWPSAYQVYASSSGEEFTPLMQVSEPAVMGTLQASLESGPLWRWDTTSEIIVKLYGGQMQSRKLLDVLAGANACAVRKGDQWEVIQFCNAELIAPMTYKLSKLLRGQLGTEHLVGIIAPTNAEFILLNQSLLKLPWTSDKAGVAFSYRVVPAGKPLGFKWAVKLSHEGSQTALMPFAPVHLKATVQENGDLALNWIRRTRWEGDSWATPDIPVQEDKLAFSLKISHKPAGETDLVLLQTYETSTDQLVIPKADLLQMLGTGTHALTCEVAQKSTKFGLGTTADCLASVTL